MQRVTFEHVNEAKIRHGTKEINVYCIYYIQ